MNLFKNLNIKRVLIFIIFTLLSFASVGILGLVFYKNKSARDPSAIKSTIQSKTFGIRNKKTKDKNYTQVNSGENDVISKNASISKVLLSVNGISCSSCVEDIKEALKNTVGITNILVDVGASKVQIYFDSKKIKNPQIIADKITKNAGYPAEVIKVYSSDEIANESELNAKKKELYIASVGGRDILRSDFDTELGALRKQYEKRYGDQASGAINGNDLISNLKTQVINQLIDEGLILQDISKAGYTLDNSLIDTEISSYLTRQNKNLSMLANDLGYSELYLRKKFTNSILINHYVNDKVISEAAGNEINKNALINQWYSAIKSLADIVYYDKDIEELSINSAAGSNCCTQ